MRRPISLKIFSIALGMLVLMATVTAISTFHLGKVNNEVRALAEYYIPLELHMSRVAIAQRSQIVHLEKLLLLESAAKQNGKAIDAELTFFQERGRKIHSEVEEAMARVAAGPKAKDLTLDPVELALLAKELPDILAVQDHLERTVLSYLGEARRGDKRVLSLLLDAITQERAKADKEVLDVSQNL